MTAIKNFFVVAWKRITSSKAAWMVLPVAGSQIWLALTGNDVAPMVTGVFTGLWVLLEVFLTINNPADKNNL